MKTESREEAEKIYASPAQWAVIQWMFHYPGIYISWSDMLDTCVNWTAQWADEAARQHMIGVLDSAFGKSWGVDNVASTSKPRIKPLSGGTPRCTFSTFKALLRVGIICKWGKTHYQLAPHVRKQLEIEELETLTAPASRLRFVTD